MLGERLESLCCPRRQRLKLRDAIVEHRQALHLHAHHPVLDPLVVGGAVKDARDDGAQIVEPRTHHRLDHAIECRAQVETSGQTGVEMEALTAVQIGLLTIYDMCKAVDRGMEIGHVRLLEKHGGKSGSYVAA